MKRAKPSVRRGLVRTTSVWSLTIGVSACSAADSDKLTEGWRDDCIGRLAQSIPGDAETAASSVEDLNEHLSGRHGKPATFDDGDDAGWTNFYEGDGITWVSPKLMQTQIDALRKRWEESLVKGIENAINGAKLVGKRLQVDYSKIDIGRASV